MKLKSIFALFFLALMFAACSRDEPVLPAAPPPPTPQKPVMNEIFAMGDVSAPDWIEIFNPNTTALDISGYKIYNSDGNSNVKPKMQIPAGTSVPARGFYVIVTDDNSAAGFALSAAGEKVWLENASGTVIDTVTYQPHTATQSYARIPDGSGPWQVSTTISRGSNNSTVSTVELVMNEIYAMGSSTTELDWVEIYNPNSVPVDITGYKIYDNGVSGGTKAKKQFPAGAIIPAHGYFVITTDTNLVTTPLADGFGLSSGGEWVWFENPAGTVVDSIKFLQHTAAQSYGRTPDGTANWQILSAKTRGAANQP